MAFQKTSILTSKNSNTYNSAAEWIAEHGPCRTEDPLVTSGVIIADGTNAVTRVLQVATLADGDILQGRDKRLDESNRSFTTVHQHEGMIEV